MPYIPEEIFTKLTEIDLLTYKQNYDPGDLFKRSSEYRLHSHDSLVISNGKWHWKSRGVGGVSAMKYLTAVEGMAVYDAALHLMDCLHMQAPVMAEVQPKPEKKSLQLPPRDADNAAAIRYLMGRGISRSVLENCIDAGILYQSTRGKFPNVVFVGHDPAGIARFACIRGLDDNNRFYGDAPDSDKRFSFSISAQKGDGLLHVFESAIDALSYATLMQQRGRDWRSTNHLSLSGVYIPVAGSGSKPQAIDRYLTDYPQIHGLALHLDNDTAGRAASEAIFLQYADRLAVTNRPPPSGKDVNEYLQNMKSRGRHELAIPVR